MRLSATARPFPMLSDAQEQELINKQPTTLHLALIILRRRNMQPRFRVTTWLVAIAVLGLILQEGSVALASGIKITGGGIKKFGDPFYFYIVELNLDPGFQFEAADSFTLEKLAGVQFPGSTTGSPGGNPGDPSGPWATTFTNLAAAPIPNFTPTTIVPTANLTFSNAFNVAQNTGAKEKFLGQFEVLTAVSLPNLPSSYFVDVSWTATLHNLAGDVVHDSGVVVLTIIPEPTSVILLGIGVSLPIGWHMHRRRRRQSRQSKQV